MRTIQTMIDQEVLACLYSLVSTLASGCGSVHYDSIRSPARELSDLAEQAMELASPVLDYEEAAREAGWRSLGHTAPSDLSSMIHYVHDDLGNEFHRCWEDLCDECGIEPSERAVFEHWAVTDWLADELEAAGEKVDKDFAGMCVWARTMTEQAIEMDAVIKRIYAECAKSVEG